MFTRYQVITLPMSLLLVAGLLGACGQAPPQVGQINVEPSTTIVTGETASLTIEAAGTGLRFKWTAARGTLSDPSAPSVLYTAPYSPGPDTVTVEISSKGGTTVRSITFQIVERPTPSPSPAPIETPLIPTEPPTPTEVPASTIPTAIPIPPLTEIFPQSEPGGTAFHWANPDGDELTWRFTDSEDCIHSGVYGLRIVYAMSGARDNGGWGVHWTAMPSGFDASGFSALVFWVKGVAGGETFQIGLKDMAHKETLLDSQEYVVVSHSEWRLVNVPLSEFKARGVNVVSLENVNLGFNRHHGSGTICVDDIAFVK